MKIKLMEIDRHFKKKKNTVIYLIIMAEKGNYSLFSHFRQERHYFN